MSYNSLEANMRRAEQDRISDMRRFEWKRLETQVKLDVSEFNTKQTEVLDAYAKEHGWTRQHMYRFAKRLYSAEFCAYYKTHSEAYESHDMEYV